MARLLKGTPKEFEENGILSHDWHESPGTTFDWLEVHEAKNRALAAIQERATVIRHPKGDSYAYYEVVKRQPLQLRWIPVGDEWQADPAWIRGLRLSDVEDMEAMSRELGNRDTTMPHGE